MSTNEILVSPCISGKTRSCDFFRIVESKEFDARAIARVLRGDIAGYIFRNAIDASTCSRIAANFWKHPGLRRRQDNVPAHFLGAYHYEKPIDEYLAEADVYRGTLHDVFAECDNVFARVMSPLGAVLAEEGVALRVAEHEGRAGSEFVMRSWTGEGAFSLEPHEDGSQLTCRRQRGFEIQRVAEFPVVAMNMCLENPSAGELHYWNIEPDLATRTRLGLAETGYPYPLEMLDGIEKIVVPIRPGDIYCFSGTQLHAVAAPASPGGYRSTISYLMGFRDPQTVIYWS